MDTPTPHERRIIEDRKDKLTDEDLVDVGEFLDSV